MNEQKITSLETILSLTDTQHPLQNFSSITYLPLSGWEEDIKRKGTLSEIIARITRMEERIRKLETK